jgi:hypothetical protein
VTWPSFVERGCVEATLAQAEFAKFDSADRESYCERQKNRDLRIALQCVNDPTHGKPDSSTANGEALLRTSPRGYWTLV